MLSALLSAFLAGLVFSWGPREPALSLSGKFCLGARPEDETEITDLFRDESEESTSTLEHLRD